MKKKMLENIIYQGKILSLILGIGTFAATFYGLYRLGHISVRAVPGYEYISEIVGRCAEMGRPCHYIPGISDLSSSRAQRTIAGLAVMGHTARLCARQGVPLWVTIAQAQVLPVAHEIMRTAYVAEGKIDEFDPSLIRYSVNQRATMVYIQGMFEREKIGGNIMVGAFFWEAINLAEMGALVGAAQVAGETMSNSIPLFAISCDMLIIGDEVFASAALASGDSKQLGTIIGLDIIKVIIVIIMALGTILAQLGSRYLYDIWSM